MVAKPSIEWFPADPANYEVGRPAGVQVEALVLHTTAGGSTVAELGAWFGRAKAEHVGSTHFGVDLAGRIGQYVSLDNTAWAHGRYNRPSARLVADNGSLNANYWAIGVEHLDGGVPGTVTPAQLEASARLAAWLWSTAIAPHAGVTGALVDRDHILGHYQFDAVDRARCPSWPEERYAWYIARVKELLGEGAQTVDWRQRYEAELRGQLAAAEDDGRRAAVRIGEVRRKLGELTSG